MKTRRSWKNQARLWKELGGTPEKLVPIEYSNRCWNCVNYPKGGRDTGACTLRGIRVYGHSENKSCWRAR